MESPDTVSLLDRRGKHIPANKLSDDKLQEITDHINSFPAYESRYTRQISERKYLQSDLTLNKMYSLYCEKFTNPVSISKYGSIFKTMNLKFKPPHADTCHKCDIFKVKIDLASEDELETIKREQSEHQNAADLGYKSKANDKAASKANSTLKVLTFDLQQCLPTPYLRTSISFYKRSLWTFNFTVHDCTLGQPFCYMWHEALARRGGNEVASCLLEHIQYLPDTVKQLIMYSDNCAGQNKNKFVATMFMIAASSFSNLEFIDHKILTVGHTHNKCDVDHSIIE